MGRTLYVHCPTAKRDRLDHLAALDFFGLSAALRTYHAGNLCCGEVRAAASDGLQLELRVQTHRVDRSRQSQHTRHPCQFTPFLHGGVGRRGVVYGKGSPAARFAAKGYGEWVIRSPVRR